MRHPLAKLGVGVAAAVLAAGVTSVSVARATRWRPEVWTEPVERREVRRTVAGQGRLQRHRRVTLTADHAARVQSVRVAAGQRVLKGQVLVTLDARAARLSLELAEARAAEQRSVAQLRRIERARLDATAGAAIVAEERQRALHGAGMASVQSLDAAQHSARTAEAEAAGAAAAATGAMWRALAAAVDVANAASRVGDHIVRAPLDGIVAEVFVQAGAAVHGGVAGTPGSRLVTLASPDIDAVAVPLARTDGDAVHPGDVALIDLPAAGGQRRIPGRVQTVRALASEAQVVLRFSPLGGVREGISVPVSFIVAERFAALAVPNHAIRTKSGASTVWIVKGDRIAETRLRLGLRGDYYTEVLGGLAPGQVVVTGPYAAMRSIDVGDRVRAVTAPQRAHDAGPPPRRNRLSCETVHR